MTALFRDLFVELPAAVFESLQAIGEAAVAKAQRPSADWSGAWPGDRRRASLFSTKYIRHVFARYGWRDAEIQRIEHDATTHVVARLDCGHEQRYPVDERAILLVRDHTDEIELLDRVVEGTARRCYCVRRPTA